MGAVFDHSHMRGGGNVFDCGHAGEKTVTASTLAVGDSVWFDYNGTLREFLVIHQGSPSTLYSNADGTWVMFKEVLSYSKWGESGALYKTSTAYSKCSTMYSSLSSDAKAVIRTVKIPYQYQYNSGSYYVSSGSSGLSTKLFLLARRELGIGTETDGTALSYFSTDTVSRIAYDYDGDAATWWTRTLRAGGTNECWYVNKMTGGTSYGYIYTETCGMRPAFVIEATTKFKLDVNGRYILA